MNNSIKGEKHHCSNCGAKFFDLNKKNIEEVVVSLLIRIDKLRNFY